MKVSIITATYNSSYHVHDALKSIQQQIYSNIEYIVIDGGSTDGTIEYIKESDIVCKYLTESDQGIYDALNKGILMATGEIIGFLHSDDIFSSPETIKNVIKTFSFQSAETGCMPDVVYGDLAFIDKKNTDKVVRFWKSEPFKPESIKRGWMPPHPTIFMRREVYDKHGLFNINLKCAADYDYILRVFRDSTLNIVYLPEVITKMRIGGISTGGVKNLINKRKEDYWVLKNNKMPYPLWILFTKNVLKIPQLFFRKKRI